ncbi:hypothetical protein UFOVP688_54 [uncultured Caudovirales phage]|uniref:Uncharacterized protein n=1 Tax=uncultured Caudovirales phage TaxID=2100421 RepID=A0A6J5NF98_9CAUD|nr:hypothetical protein UFOVP688_54 [uncultured Caudovirales phage]
MPKTYEPIASTTATGSSTVISFTSIPQTYTDLIIIFSGFATTGNFYIRVNSDTSAIYSQTQLRGNGSVAGASRETGQQNVYVGDFIADPISAISNAVMHFNNYANTTTFKSFILRGNNSAKFTDLTAGLWRSTAAITGISVHSSGANLDSTSVATLYGIKAA